MNDVDKTTRTTKMYVESLLVKTVCDTPRLCYKLCSTVRLSVLSPDNPSIIHPDPPLTHIHHLDMLWATRCIYGRIMLCYNWSFSFIPGSDCLGSFRLSPFNASGTCTCQKQKVSLQCDCHEGFSGFMCSSIVLRYCKPKDNIEPEIPHCKDSNEESCHLNQDGKYYLCVAFDGKF